MVNVNQIKAGLGDYISRSMMPKLDSKRQFLLGMVYGMCAGKMDAIIETARQNSFVRALGIISDSGEIDLDALYNAACAQMQQQGALSFDIPLMGTFAFNADDLRELYNAINGRQTA